MTPINMIPEVLTDFNVYDEGEKLVGITATVSLPTLEAMTETISGAGMAGEYNATVPGHFAPISMEIPFEVMNISAAKIYAKKNVSLTLRGSVQMRDLATGEVRHEKTRVVVSGIPSTLNPGQMAKAKKSAAAIGVEILRFELYMGEEEIIALDKASYVFRIFGVDQLADIRANV